RMRNRERLRLLGHLVHHVLVLVFLRQDQAGKKGECNHQFSQKWTSAARGERQGKSEPRGGDAGRPSLDPERQRWTLPSKRSERTDARQGRGLRHLQRQDLDEDDSGRKRWRTELA